MRLLRCPVCRARVYFENDGCLTCGTALGFRPESFEMVAVGDGDGPWDRCANLWMAGCNWVVPSGGGGSSLCRSCSLTRTRPADDDEEGRARFAEAETAKRRLVAQLFDLGLPIVGFDEAADGLGFDLLSSHFDEVVTGHEDGIVTVDLAEADNAHRERVRQELGEAYRTVLGHFRHEVGHYYWTVLVEGTNALDGFRTVFGDERADYGEAMSSHYGGGPPVGWEATHVSAYATMHPWEDWAETFAHLLHLRDTLQTAGESGVTVADPDGETSAPLSSADDFDVMVKEWVGLTRALNELNRSMGEPDLYPFVLAPAVIGKLAFVDRLVRNAALAAAR
jgi:hypothetical protein